MGIDLVVKVHYEYSSEREFQIVSQEQGRCREAGAEGSWRQNCGLQTETAYKVCMMDESAE